MGWLVAVFCSVLRTTSKQGRVCFPVTTAIHFQSISQLEQPNYLTTQPYQIQIYKLIQIEIRCRNRASKHNITFSKLASLFKHKKQNNSDKHNITSLMSADSHYKTITQYKSLF